MFHSDENDSIYNIYFFNKSLFSFIMRGKSYRQNSSRFYTRDCRNFKKRSWFLLLQKDPIRGISNGRLIISGMSSANLINTKERIRKGTLTFQPPKPVEPWTETLDATEDGPVCFMPITEYFKDCLRLNVYTRRVGN